MLTQAKKIRDKERFGGLREAVLKRDRFMCARCGMTRKQHYKKYGRDITVDHIDGKGRYSKAKNNTLSNLQTLCLSCHGKKDIYRSPNSYPRPVVQYDKNGEIINIYGSAREAEKMGFDNRRINIVVTGHGKTYKGYLWRYA